MINPPLTILLLPEAAVLNVLRCMEVYELFNFALTSRQSQLFAKSLKSKIEKIEISVSDTLEIKCLRVGFRLPIKLVFDSFESSEVTIAHSNNRWNHIKYGWNFKSWCDHLSSFFNIARIHQVFFHPGKFAPTNAHLHKMCDQLAVEVISVWEGPWKRDYRFVFNLATKGVWWLMDPFAYQKGPQPFMMTNLDYLHFSAFNMKILDDLLMLNCVGASVEHPDLVPKQFNKFIKLWMRGMTPKLTYIIFFGLSFSKREPVILKGIKYEDISMNVTRSFRTFPGNRLCIIRGGFDVKLKDGRKATIWSGKYRNSNALILVIW